MTKQTFLEIQDILWDSSPSYPDELTKEAWLELCGKFYDENEGYFDEDYDKEKFAARPPKPNRVLPCGCEQAEDADEKSGYFIWVTIKTCEEHKPGP